jgi:hypothetical protein
MKSKYSKEKIQSLYKLKISTIKKFDNNDDGNVDLFESDNFMLFLQKNQNKIIDIDKKYVLDFIKIHEYLSKKKYNINEILKSIKSYNLKELKYIVNPKLSERLSSMGDSANERIGIVQKLKNQLEDDKSDLEELLELLISNIDNYNLILFHSLNMITYLIDGNMINFYKLYQMFDKLNIFSSNLGISNSEQLSKISEKLSNLEYGIGQLISNISKMEKNLLHSIEDLTYVTEQSNSRLEFHLKEIDSTMKVGNLISVINTYQNYKINQNTKSLRG